MPVARPEPAETRVIAHLDLDCFYVQVEQRKRPELRGKPSAVVQFNPWKGGGLIAVSYEARRAGVTRNMRGDDAKKVCPDIELVQVPMAHGHAYLAPYRDAGSEVVAILSRMGTCERASVDEVYLDITEAAAARLLEDPPLSQSLSEEAQRTHVLGLVEVNRS
jgi:DNA polymerase eta